MVVQILVAQGQGVDPLGQHLLHAMVATILRPEIGEAGRQSLQQADAPVGLPQQQCPSIGGKGATVEVSYNGPRKMGFKLEAELITLCVSQQKPRPPGSKHLVTQMSMPEIAAFC